jgi:hypothetical protein
MHAALNDRMLDAEQIRNCRFHAFPPVMRAGYRCRRQAQCFAAADLPCS